MRLNDGSAATPALTFEDGAGMYNHQGNVVFTTQLQATGFVGDGSQLTGIKIPPSINTITITDASWTPIDDTALSTSTTGYLVIDGANFETGTNVSIGGTAAASITLVNSTLLRVSINPKTTGTYDVVVETGDGSITKVNAVSFDPVPVWQTGTSLGNVYVGTEFSITLAASDGGSNITYANTTALPPSTTLATNGTLSGTITETSSTTYNFSVEAIDAQLQSAIRSFSLLYSSFVASGGTVTTSGAYKIHTFTTNGTFTAGASKTVQYLIVAGGGGGGTALYSGGGGAGGLLTSSVSVNAGSYSVVVGNGGAQGVNGSNSSFNGIVTIGGGYGGTYGGTITGAAGGSGGGGAYSAGAPGSGTAGQGYSGGGASSTGGYGWGGGGGGAGGVGTTVVINSTPGSGGPGAGVSIAGQTQYFAGGGGGNIDTTGWSAYGGVGGGGNGSVNSGGLTNTDGTNGSPNTGGGGGVRASGGSGIIILWYLA